MIVTSLTSETLAFRRETRNLQRGGFQRTTDFDWRLTHGPLSDHVIAEVKIASDGKQVWYRLEKARPERSQA